MIITEDKIDLWFVKDCEIHDEYLLARYAQLLSDEEQARQRRFHFARHRHQYLVTRAMVRSVLSLYSSDIAPEAWVFKNNEYGKPAICDEQCGMPVRFNISHTEGLVVMAVTLEQELGVDVENLQRGGETLGIANRYFSQSELRALQQLPAVLQRERFFDLWTLKEAYIKACGMGLSIPLDHFSYSFSGQGEIVIAFDPEREDHPERWRFWQIRMGAEHKVALAVKKQCSDSECSLSMRNYTPLAAISEADYPVERESYRGAF